VGPPLLVVNADVRTMDRAVPTGQVIAIDGGVVLEVGPTELAAKYAGSDVVDLGARLVLPGFVDAHHHLSVEALHPIWVDLRGAPDAETIVGRLRRAAEAPGDGWIRGCQWNSLTVRLSRDDLDAVGTDRPILVACASFHRGLVSSAGIDALGLTAQIEDPPGGRFGRDASGAPNGFLRETAWGLAHAATIRSFGDPDRWGDLIVERCQELLRHGITALHDTTVSASAAAVYAALATSGRLPISVLGFPHGEEILTGMDDAAWRLGPTGEGNERYRTGPVKLFADGGPDFAIDACMHGQRIEAGILFPQLREAMHQAYERGFGVAVHATGNLALRNAIAAWQEGATASTPPLRVEHAALAGPNEVRDLQRIGATAVVQPAMVNALAPVATRLDFDEETWMPFRDLDDAGVLMAASSDSPCSISAPLLESSFGVTRRSEAGVELVPDQSLPYERWLEMYTAGAADAGGQTDERGRLRPGLRADLVVLDGTLADPTTLRVAETWVSGTRVYTAS
jgi:predicted amidohydrolase YtcJ